MKIIGNTLFGIPIRRSVKLKALKEKNAELEMRVAELRNAELERQKGQLEDRARQKEQHERKKRQIAERKQAARNRLIVKKLRRAEQLLMYLANNDVPEPRKQRINLYLTDIREELAIYGYTMPNELSQVMNELTQHGG